MTPEGKVKLDVKKALAERSIWYYMPMQNGFGVTGIPDFVCCWQGMFIGIECKAPGKVSTVTPGQRRCLDDIRKHGGRAVVVTSGVEAAAWLDLLGSLECQTS